MSVTCCGNITEATEKVNFYLVSITVKALEPFGINIFLVAVLVLFTELLIVREKVNISVFCPELLGSALSDGIYQLNRKIIALYIGNLGGRIVFMNGRAYCKKKMGLAKTGVAVYEKGIISFAAGIEVDKMGLMDIGVNYDEGKRGKISQVFYLFK